MRKRILLLGGGVVAIVAIGVVALTVVLAGTGAPTESGRPPQEPTKPALPTSTPGPGVAPGEPTPPPARDTPVSNRDTPVPPPVRPSPPPVGTPFPTMRILAPIESAQIAVLESFPPQYLLQVKAGLPNGCALADGYDLTRSGNEIKIAVYDTLPSVPVVCTQVYGIYDLNLNLGSNFTSGQVYRIDVNGKQVTFTAQ